jgi:hypothetical protein
MGLKASDAPGPSPELPAYPSEGYVNAARVRDFLVEQAQRMAGYVKLHRSAN